MRRHRGNRRRLRRRDDHLEHRRDGRRGDLPPGSDVPSGSALRRGWDEGASNPGSDEVRRVLLGEVRPDQRPDVHRPELPDEVHPDPERVDCYRPGVVRPARDAGQDARRERTNTGCCRLAEPWGLAWGRARLAWDLPGQAPLWPLERRQPMLRELLLREQRAPERMVPERPVQALESIPALREPRLRLELLVPAPREQQESGAGSASVPDGVRRAWQSKQASVRCRRPVRCHWPVRHWKHRWPERNPACLPGRIHGHDALLAPLPWRTRI